ncbi:TDT family transporter [Corynebacterium choanae]|uniref:C4-dicarboxylate transporter/malic acid transport protein n=1 Tax=Corynebacterium choanae TaxID=1862358 RepID=A0A3G6J6M2_9CORY|nr:TDT family transporter [Corynebacterium choanae]AZA12568.1 C4-dicarboxylate transporter/malic acid transport protein [Corynebacterium choanae]
MNKLHKNADQSTGSVVGDGYGDNVTESILSGATINRTGRPSRPPSQVPPAGPVWFGSTMGTGILSTLLFNHQHHVGLFAPLSLVMLVIGWVLLVGLSVAFAVRCVRNPAIIRPVICEPTMSPAWGMVAMGYLAVGSATYTVLPAFFPATQSIVDDIDLVMWLIGTTLGVITAIGFAAVLMRGNVGDPTPVWGLPLVPPTVSATTGAIQVPHLPNVTAQIVMLTVSVGCFFVALALGMAVFIVAYEHAWRRARLPLAASAASCIPLGIVGQSTAAAQALSSQAQLLSIPAIRPALQEMANYYGVVVLTLGVPLLAWAIYTTVRGWYLRMPFSPGWWATTFPIGTLCLGAHLLAGGSGHPAWDWISFVLLLLLCTTWSISALASVWAVIAHLRREQAA